MQEDARLIYAPGMSKLLSEVPEMYFQTDLRLVLGLQAKEKMKHDSTLCESVFCKLALNGTFKVILGRCVVKKAQSSLSTDVFASTALHHTRILYDQFQLSAVKKMKHGKSKLKQLNKRKGLVPNVFFPFIVVENICRTQETTS